MIQDAVAQFQGIIWQAAILGVCGTVFGGLIVFAFMYMFLERQKGILAVALVVGLALAACTGAYFLGRANPIVQAHAPVVSQTPPDPHIYGDPRPRVNNRAWHKPRPIHPCTRCRGQINVPYSNGAHKSVEP